jgi:type IV secretion system protein VirD4
MKRFLPDGAIPRLVLLGVAAACLGWLMHGMPEQTPGARWWPWLLVGGIADLVAVAVYFAHRRVSSAGKVERWAQKSQRNDGVASAWEIWRVSGRHAMRKLAKQLRPSVAELGWFARLRVPTREYGTPLARVGWQRVWSPIEDITVRIGGPRTGKSGELGCRILDAPGAVIATSTRTDLLERTGPVRSRKGPIYVFNPSGVGGRASTITFDPLSGCTDPKTAAERAADLLSGSASPGRGIEGDFWTDQAKRVLAILLHAAALGEASMRDVLSWVADPEAAAADLSQFLRRSPEPAFEAEAVQFLGNNERTRTSICTTIMPALGWLRDATAAAAATGGGFDVPDLLDRRGTVYMLGAEDAQVAPLVAALTGHIAREARRIAAGSPGGRLDPPLTLALDEAALICPIPLDSWTADMGGRGVTIHIAVQSRAQLRQRWGDMGAAAILNNAATVLIFGGSRDPEDLAAYSTLTGDRYETVESFDKDGVLTGKTTRRVPVLTPAQISNLPQWHVLIVKRGMPPAIGVVALMWNNRAVRRAERQAKRAAKRVMWRAEWDLARTFLAEEAAPRLAALRRRIGELALRVAEWATARADDARRNHRARAAARQDEERQHHERQADDD